MANIAKWVAGAGSIGLTWTTVFGTELNSLAAPGGSNYAKGTVVVSNGTDFNQFMDISAVITANASTTAFDFITLYLLPKNGDGSTYGDNISSGATTPASQYAVGNIVFVVAGTALKGQLSRIILPPGDFIMGVANNTTVALSASAGTIYGRVYDTNLNG